MKGVLGRGVLPLFVWCYSLQNAVRGLLCEVFFPQLGIYVAQGGLRDDDFVQ